MTRRQLEAELTMLREIAGLLEAALKSKHCPQDCSCRISQYTVTAGANPATTAGTATLYWPGNQWFWTAGDGGNT